MSSPQRVSSRSPTRASSRSPTRVSSRSPQRVSVRSPAKSLTKTKKEKPFSKRQLVNALVTVAKILGLDSVYTQKFIEGNRNWINITNNLKLVFDYTYRKGKEDTLQKSSFPLETIERNNVVNKFRSTNSRLYFMRELANNANAFWYDRNLLIHVDNSLITILHIDDDDNIKFIVNEGSFKEVERSGLFTDTQPTGTVVEDQEKDLYYVFNGKYKKVKDLYLDFSIGKRDSKTLARYFSKNKFVKFTVV